MTIYSIIDFETTGLDANHNQTIEIACMKTDLTRNLGTFHTYVKLHLMNDVPEFIVGLTGVTNDLTATGMKEEDAMDLLGAFIENTVVVAQFVPFDFSYLAKFGIHPPQFLCTRTLARVIEPDLPAGLAKVYERLFNKPVPKHHSALFDVKATLEVLIKQMAITEDRGIPDIRNIVVDSADRPLTFIPKYSEVLTMEL